jgi:Glutaredoxin and related proteins
MKLTTIAKDLKSMLQHGKVFMFSKTYCPYCDRAKWILDKHKINYDYVECDEIPLTPEQSKQLREMSGISTFPNIFIGKKSIGGCDNLTSLERSGELKKILEENGIQQMKSF